MNKKMLFKDRLIIELESGDKKFTAQNARFETSDQEDHRLTLRIPQYLLAKVDEGRKKRVGGISRNQFILELIDKYIQNA